MLVRQPLPKTLSWKKIPSNVQPQFALAHAGAAGPKMMPCAAVARKTMTRAHAGDRQLFGAAGPKVIPCAAVVQKATTRLVSRAAVAWMTRLVPFAAVARKMKTRLVSRAAVAQMTRLVPCAAVARETM